MGTYPQKTGSIPTESAENAFMQQLHRESEAEQNMSHFNISRSALENGDAGR